MCMEYNRKISSIWTMNFWTCYLCMRAQGALLFFISIYPHNFGIVFKIKKNQKRFIYIHFLSFFAFFCIIQIRVDRFFFKLLIFVSLQFLFLFGWKASKRAQNLWTEFLCFFSLQRNKFGIRNWREPKGKEKKIKPAKIQHYVGQSGKASRSSMASFDEVHEKTWWKNIITEPMKI